MKRLNVSGDISFAKKKQKGLFISFVSERNEPKKAAKQAELGGRRSNFSNRLYNSLRSNNISHLVAHPCTNDETR